ncbi:Hypothetical_protein [Hexamita inflata]|uniref:Hypothetical_protein n=1 Tax=Hexamita inflata TaxID=28002 RepID=A0AA86NSJ4_9EUKA|nr:Hypothetical protein HINF_LOCUS13347 [Hexamita inflata]
MSELQNDQGSSQLLDKATDLANQAVDELVPEDYKPFGRQAVQTLGQIPRAVKDYKLGHVMSPTEQFKLGDVARPKPLTGWQKFKRGFGKFFNIIKGPASKLIGSLPFGSFLQKGADAASGLINHFKGKK